MELNIEVKDILTNSSIFYSFDKEQITIGRKPDLDIPIKNKYISDNHVTLFINKSDLFIRDDGSTNGSEYYSQYRWHPLSGKKNKVPVPVQIKLAEAVVITLQSGESRIHSLSDNESDVAIMVLDICNSTRQAIKNESLAFHQKQRLNQIAKPILYKGNVLFYKNTGDGFLATFDRTTQAVNASIAIMKELEKRNRGSKNPPIEVRVGLHKGTTYVIDPATEDLHGIDINITFRIEGLKNRSFAIGSRKIPEKNRILASEDFIKEYKKKSRRKNDLFHYTGNARLKGIKDKMKIYIMHWEKDKVTRL